MKRYKLIQACGANAELAEKIALANNAGISLPRRGQKGEPKVVHNYVVMKNWHKYRPEKFLLLLDIMAGHAYNRI